MKTFLLSTLVIIFISFTSCSSDDDAPSGPIVPSAVYATWNMSFFQEDGNLVTEVPCDLDIEYTFNSNGTYSKTLFTDSNNGENCEISVSFNGNWEAIEDNVIELTPSSQSFEQEVLNLRLINNNNQLEIERSATLLEVYDKN
ncbi:lipocalin family protein [Psychroflexus sp. MBR-150]|jgi:hypothetical protein